MPLPPGTRLGPYEIVTPLGAGGMGEVFRARDTRLGRDVAVKVLPAHLSSHPEVRSRFEREARTISSLNHPHICTLFDVGREGDIDYLVMELVDGETLADRLARGALPTGEVLRLGGQIADALQRAHQAGVIHRDLKPGNIMLTKSGAKLMDFGLARATGLAGPGGASGLTAGGLSHSPTVAQPLTAEGTIIGTFQYMAPEQLEGKEADARADLWALGCVLYEMATGKRAFEGTSQASLIAAIMHRQPTPVSQLVPMTPPALDRLVTGCLAKDPADRVQSAHDVKLQLAWIAEEAPSTFGTALPTPPSARRLPWRPIALGMVAGAIGMALVLTLLPRRTAAPDNPVQSFILGSAELQFSSAPMLSPDGASVIYSARTGSTRRLYRRPLSSFESTAIEGTEDGTGPFFSPDGAWLGFITTAGIRKVPIAGGVAQTILNESRVDACDWGEDGTIYFTPRSGGSDGWTALARVPASGGALETVARIDTASGETETWLPEILPDGKTVLVSVVGTGDRKIVAVRPDGSRHTVVENGFLSRFAPPGHLLYAEFQSRAVLAAPFDPVTARITGPAFPVTSEQVDFNHCFDVSPAGMLVYVPLPGAGQGEEVIWLDRKGVAAPALETRDTWAQPRLSADGTRLLLRKSGTNCELWMLDLARGSLVRVVHEGDNHDAVWSPDGRRLACLKMDGGRMVTISVEGAREVTTLIRGAGAGRPQTWSAGGNRLVYTLTQAGRRDDIWIRRMDGSSEPERFLATEFNETDPSISPDGDWIAYVSNEAGPPQVFVRRCPDTGTTWQISTDGGGSPLWSRDGRELFFVSGTRMMAARVETAGGFRADPPVELFDGGFSVVRPRDFDVGLDGRFVALRAGGASGQKELRLLLNWEQGVSRASRTAH